MGAGVAVFHQPRITIEHTVADDTEAERHRVYAAFDKMREQIDRMASSADFGVGGEHEEVIETYKMFAYDEGWSRRIRSEEHTSELQSLMRISYAVFCLKNKNKHNI